MLFRSLAAVQAPDLARVGLHDTLPEGDLSVPADGDPAIAPDGENGGPVNALWIVFHRDDLGAARRPFKRCAPSGAALTPTGAGVRGVVDLREVLEIQVRVDLCGGDVGVSQQFLDAAQVRAGFE